MGFWNSRLCKLVDEEPHLFTRRDLAAPPLQTSSKGRGSTKSRGVDEGACCTIGTYKNATKAVSIRSHHSDQEALSTP